MPHENRRQDQNHAAKADATRDQIQSAAPLSTPLLLQRAYADPSSLTPKDVLHLQRTIGNRATIGILSKHTGIQAKLKLGPAGDQYEREADRVAQQVVRQMSAQPLRPQPVQRQPLEEEELQMKPLAGTISPLQRKDEPRPKVVLTKPAAGTIPQPKPPAATISRVQRAPTPHFTKSLFAQRQEEEDELQMKPLHGSEGGEVEQSVEKQIQTARGGGKPLDNKVRGSMEKGFGADFSNVRVHTGGQADKLNRSLNARAFTVGSDLFFKSGEYNPGSSGGKQLLAHELTHTVQQGAAGAQREMIQPKLAGAALAFRQQGGGLTGEVVAKKVFSLGIYKSTYEKILNAVIAYEKEEAKGKKSTSWFVNKLTAIENLCNNWLGGKGHQDELDSARASAIETLLDRVTREKKSLGGGSTSSLLIIDQEENDFEESKEKTSESLGGKITITATSGGSTKYDFGFVAKGSTELGREAIFTKYVDNCKLAGLPVSEVLTAARKVLGKWEGWEHPAVLDFDYGYVEKFKDRVLEDVRGATSTIVKACFTMNPNLELLRSFAEDMEPVEVEEEFELENEEEFVWQVSSSFDNTGDKEAFIKLWDTSDSAMRRQIFSLVSTEKSLKSLTTMGYLVEALDKKHRYDLNAFLGSWTRSSTTLDFFTWLEAQSGAKEKSSVRYYNEEERQQFVITVGSVLKRFNGKPLVGDNIFVMSKQNILYADNKDTTSSVRLHHSSFLSGQAVKAAGHLYTDSSGKLYKIDNSSGHYGPTDAHLAQALAVLKKQGVDLDEVQVSRHKGGIMTAEEFLGYYL
jgi:hypothetical protein